MKKVITFDFSMLPFFKALDASRIKDKKDGRTQLHFIYFDAEDSCFIATNGRTLLKVNVSGEKLISQFGGEPAFCTLINDSTLIAEDTFNGEDSQYIAYKRVIPNIDKDYDRYDIPYIKKTWELNKKYVPFIVNQLVSREADAIYNPEFFEKIKDIINYMTIAFYPHIETWEEEKARLENEKDMSSEERNNARSIREKLRYKATVLMSQDEIVTYLIMPIIEES